MISMGTLIPVKLCLSNCAVFVISVSHSDVRRGRQLWVTVRWAGTNPLFECPWLDSEVQIGDLTCGRGRGTWNALSTRMQLLRARLR